MDDTLYYSCVIPINPKGQTLLAIRKEDGLWTSPCGGGHAGETPEECAVREAWEEAQLKVKKEKLEPLGVVRAPNGKPVHCYLYRTTQKRMSTVADPDSEVRKWQWYDSDKLPKGLSRENNKNRLDTINQAYVVYHGLNKAEALDLNESLTKGKNFPVGTIRTWDGHDYIKKPDGSWAPHGHTGLKEEEEPKAEPKKEEEPKAEMTEKEKDQKRRSDALKRKVELQRQRWASAPKMSTHVERAKKKKAEEEAAQAEKDQETKDLAEKLKDEKPEAKAPKKEAETEIPAPESEDDKPELSDEDRSKLPMDHPDYKPSAEQEARWKANSQKATEQMQEEAKQADEAEAQANAAREEEEALKARVEELKAKLKAAKEAKAKEQAEKAAQEEQEKLAEAEKETAKQSFKEALAKEQAAASKEAATDERDPREVSADSQEKDQYYNARESEYSNIGEDLAGSARHKRGEYTESLKAMETDGIAEKMVTRDKILKYESVDFDEITADNMEAVVAAHFCVKTFTAKPNYKYRSTKYSPEEVREEYLDTFRRFRAKAEEVSRMDDGTGKSLDEEEVRAHMYSHLGKEIERLRGTEKAEGYDTPMSSNLVDLRKQFRTARWGRPSSRSVQAKMEQFTGSVRGGYFHADDPAPTPEKAVEAAQAIVLDGKTVEKAFGTQQAKVKKKSRADYYAGNKTLREGGKPAPKGYKAQEKFVSEKLGFRGMQWGNSVTDAERVHHMERTAEAFTDLTEALGLPLEMASFNGRLGYAVGARGKGGALAHYEPWSGIINLTRNGGVGTVAHEWAHFFDNTISDVSGIGGGVNHSVRDHVNAFIKERVDAGKDHPSDAEIKKEVAKRYGVAQKDALGYVRGGFASKINTKSGAYNKPEIREGIEMWRKGDKSGAYEKAQTNGTYGWRNQDHFNRWAEHNEPKMAEEDRVNNHPVGKAFSELKGSEVWDEYKTQVRDAVRGDTHAKKAQYWLSDHEMFARAFETHINHKLSGMGRKNSYLSGISGNGEGGLWPSKEQASKMAPMFDKIFEEFKGSELLKKSMELTLLEKLQKGKKFPSGTIREWNGVQVEKSPEGKWVRVSSPDKKVDTTAPARGVEKGLRDSGIKFTRTDTTTGSIYFETDSGFKIRVSNHKSSGKDTRGSADVDINPESNKTVEEAIREAVVHTRDLKKGVEEAIWKTVKEKFAKEGKEAGLDYIQGLDKGDELRNELYDHFFPKEGRNRSGLAVNDMHKSKEYTETARKIGKKLGVDFDKISLKEFAEGIEEEHEEHSDTLNGNLEDAAKIAYDHLKEDPKYYTKLEEMEKAVTQMAHLSDGADLDTGAFSTELDGTNEKWLKEFQLGMEGFEYGDTPVEFGLDQGILYLTKVDDGVYTGFYRAQDPVHHNGEVEALEDNAKVRIERMTLPTLVQFLMAKEWIGYPEVTKQPNDEGIMTYSELEAYSNLNDTLMCESPVEEMAEVLDFQENEIYRRDQAIQILELINRLVS